MNSEKFIFSCMYGQERSVEVQSLAKNKGYDTELVAGGLYSITHQVQLLHEIASATTGESLYSFTTNIRQRIKENPELLSSVRINSSHSVYFRNLISRPQREACIFIVTIDEDEVRKVQPGLALLATLGEVYIVELSDLLLAIMCHDLTNFLSTA